MDQTNLPGRDSDRYYGTVHKPTRNQYLLAAVVDVGYDDLCCFCFAVSASVAVAPPVDGYPVEIEIACAGFVIVELVEAVVVSGAA